MSKLEEKLAELENIARNPKAQFNRFLEDGRKVVGCMPYFCPEELVYAAGMVPFGLWGRRAAGLRSQALLADVHLLHPADHSGAWPPGRL